MQRNNSNLQLEERGMRTLLYLQRKTDRKKSEESRSVSCERMGLTSARANEEKGEDKMMKKAELMSCSHKQIKQKSNDYHSTILTRSQGERRKITQKQTGDLTCLHYQAFSISDAFSDDRLLRRTLLLACPLFGDGGIENDEVNDDEESN